MIGHSDFWQAQRLCMFELSTALPLASGSRTVAGPVRNKDGISYQVINDKRMETLSNTELIQLFKEAVTQPVSFDTLVEMTINMIDLERCDVFIF